MQTQLRPCCWSRPAAHGVGPPAAGSKGVDHRTSGSSRSLLSCAAANSPETPVSPYTGAQLQQQRPQLSSGLLTKQATATAAAGAVLGPLCDGLHSKAGVLHYVAPIHIQVGSWQLETCWWVPALFGLAGVILGVGYPLLDTLATTTSNKGGSSSTSSNGGINSGSSSSSRSSIGAPVGVTRPGWPTVLLVISLFISQYWLSGQLTTGASNSTAQLLGQLPPQLPAVDLLLATYGWLVWRVFDATPQGLFMSCLTAVAGPAIEVGLIQGLHLYAYTQPHVAGIPTWIPWVYFCGGPAVGLLGRQVWAQLVEQQEQPAPSQQQ